VALCDLSGEPIVDDYSMADVDHAPAESLDLAHELVRQALHSAGVAPDQLLGVGMGLAVPINKATGELEADGILPGWRGIRPAEEMEARLGVPVALDNDANVGALGEKAFGAARGVDDLLYVRQPYPGVAGVAGEIGQVLSDPSGPIYRCGNRGCLEAVASPATLARETPARCRTRGQQHVRRRGRLRWVVDEFRRRRGS
jgi:predicted NBD/HSP70 family sugar kinase